MINNSTNPQAFTLDVTNTNTTKYRIANDSAPVAVVEPESLAFSDPANWLTIGSQVWAKHNLNVGTMVIGATAQADNAVLEKYCYSGTEANCTTYGGLYQWNEAIRYVTIEGLQGIFKAVLNIISDNY